MRFVGLEGYEPPGWPRLGEPDVRSLVVGYLSTAPVVAPGYRTDGDWVWPDDLAHRVGAHGVGLRPEHLEHIRACGYLAPDDVAPDRVRAAVDAVEDESPGRRDERDVRYLAVRFGPDWPPTDLFRIGPAGIRARLTPAGWRASTALPAGAVQEIPSSAAAAQLADDLCERWHDRLLDRAVESSDVDDGPRLAKVFDGDDPSGQPWFSPDRLRIVDSARRERLAAYLAGGRLVVRATGRASDPFTNESEPVVPLHFRTDGVWVWQEALVHYVRTRGVAPQLAFLCHIEARGARLPASVPDEVARRAAEVAAVPPSPRPPRLPTVYFTDGSRALVRVHGGDRTRAEALDGELRWRWSDVRWVDLREITEDEAVKVLDERCEATASATNS